MRKERLTQVERKNKIIKDAVFVAEMKGYQNLVRQEIAERGDISGSLVQFHFHTIQLLKDAVLKEAIKTENLRIIFQACASKENMAEIPKELRNKAIKHIMKIDD